VPEVFAAQAPTAVLSRFQERLIGKAPIDHHWPTLSSSPDIPTVKGLWRERHFHKATSTSAFMPSVQEAFEGCVNALSSPSTVTLARRSLAWAAVIGGAFLASLFSSASFLGQVPSIAVHHPVWLQYGFVAAQLAGAHATC
jgi:hypothetical protein